MILTIIDIMIGGDNTNILSVPNIFSNRYRGKHLVIASILEEDIDRVWMELYILAIEHGKRYMMLMHLFLNALEVDFIAHTNPTLFSSKNLS